MHVPLLQTSATAHACPQVPQLSWLLVVSTHAPLQLVSPLPHEPVMHAP
jgi:hypothetical protein